MVVHASSVRFLHVCVQEDCLSQANMTRIDLRNESFNLVSHLAIENKLLHWWRASEQILVKTFSF